MDSKCDDVISFNSEIEDETSLTCGEDFIGDLRRLLAFMTGGFRLKSKGSIGDESIDFLRLITGPLSGSDVRKSAADGFFVAGRPLFLISALALSLSSVSKMLKNRPSIANGFYKRMILRCFEIWRVCKLLNF